MGLSQEELGAIVGRHRTSLERSGLPPQSKEGQLGLLFLRVMRHWLVQPNHHLGEQAPRQLLASVEGLALPQTRNLLLNPLHPAMAQVVLVHQEPFQLDQRLG